MKKIQLVLLTCILGLNNLYAAERECHGNRYEFCVGEKYYIYADIANIRTAPNVSSEIKFKFSAGQEVVIVSIAKDSEGEIDGVGGIWLLVSTTDEEKNTGWIWSNSLSCKQLRRGNVKFVFGMDKYVKDKYKCTIKAVDNGKIVDRKSYELYPDGTAFNNAKIIDNVWLENVKYVVHLDLGGGACAFPTSNLYFAWLDEKKKLVELPPTFSVGDACAVSYGESLYVPSENNGGMYNLLLKVTEEGIPPKDDKFACEYDKWDWKYKTELFKWNGEKVIIIKNNQIKK